MPPIIKPLCMLVCFVVFLSSYNSGEIPEKSETTKFTDYPTAGAWIKENLKTEIAYSKGMSNQSMIHDNEDYIIKVDAQKQ